jgi:predicted HicB family RNase H-like nuclease
MAKSRQMLIRIEETEKEGFEKAASLSGLSLSAWARERLRKATVRELEEASLPIPFIEYRRD